MEHFKCLCIHAHLQHDATTLHVLLWNAVILRGIGRTPDELALKSNPNWNHSSFPAVIVSIQCDDACSGVDSARKESTGARNYPCYARPNLQGFKASMLQFAVRIASVLLDILSLALPGNTYHGHAILRLAFPCVCVTRGLSRWRRTFRLAVPP